MFTEKTVVLKDDKKAKGDKKKFSTDEIREQGLGDDILMIENEVYNWLIMSAYQAASSKGSNHKERKKKNINHKSNKKTK